MRHMLVGAAGIAVFVLVFLLSSVVYAQGDGAAPSALSRITEIAFEILTPVLALFAMWAAHRLIAVFEKKTGIAVPVEQEQMISRWIRQGVARAEEWSHKKIKEKTDALTGPEKLEISAAFVLDLIEAQGWIGWTADRIRDKIEAELGIQRANGNLSRTDIARPRLPAA